MAAAKKGRLRVCTPHGYSRRSGLCGNDSALSRGRQADGSGKRQRPSPFFGVRRLDAAFTSAGGRALQQCQVGCVNEARCLTPSPGLRILEPRKWTERRARHVTWDIISMSSQLTYYLVVGAFALLVYLAWRFLPRPYSESIASPRDDTGDSDAKQARQGVDEAPDRPVAFGYKIAWLAVHTHRAEEVIDALPISDLRRANWRTGIDAAYGGATFVSPPVNGWVFVISSSLPELGCDEESLRKWSTLTQSLAERFDDVQYFATHRIVDYHAWARLIQGKERRAFAYLGERGETLVDRGTQTAAEEELGHAFFDERSPEAESDAYWEREDLAFPDEENVTQVAGKWSIDPTTLGSPDDPLSVGWIGTLAPAASR